ncbi:MAG TPA: hypothetical protein VEU30_01495, partial [Thermoanaerobaculia bacterium]|nr:hypothetical protein [Thermoanaerobaculia bacterium]
MQRSSRLLALNDPRLAAYLAAPDEDTRARELASVLEKDVAPIVRTMLGNYARAEWPIQRADAEDIAAQVNLRLIRKLQAALVLDEESVQNLEAYVVTLTRNGVRDLMRLHSPQRSRMRSRFRYLFMHDERLAIWDRGGVTVCGLAGWKGEPLAPERVPRPSSPVIRDQRRPAEGVLQLLQATGEPLRLSDVVSFFMDAWGISDETAV